MRYHIIYSRTATTKKSVGEDVEKLELLGTIREIQNGTAAVENSMVLPQNTKHRLTIQF